MAGIGASEWLGARPCEYLRRRIKSRTGNSGKSFSLDTDGGFLPAEENPGPDDAGSG